MFLDAGGNAIPEASHWSGAIGVPGTVAGLSLALEKYGTMRLAQVMAPAVALARRRLGGDADFARSAQEASDALGHYIDQRRRSSA